ncbi:MAG: hypothetical protein IPG63_05405 [Xanthomonadales bacterium]|nr:hypothetical protein [Xanthomonadales bacterium]MBK7143955.1 hypothetical protein [Xanthomonadales bacterium]
MLQRRLALGFALALVGACLANGASLYLRRIGVVDPDFHRAYLAAYCDPAAALPCRCMDFERAARLDSPPSRESLGQVRPAEHALRMLKDGLFAAFVLISLLLVRRDPGARATLRTSGPLPWFALSLLVAAAIAVFDHGALLALIGLRPFAFLAVAAIGLWMAAQMKQVAALLPWLLAIEVLLVGVEYLHGLPMRRCPHSFRAVGSFVLPNSLGMASAVLVAFWATQAESTRAWPAVLLLAVALTLASGSATAAFALLALAALRLWRRPGTSRILVAGGAVAAALLFAALLPGWMSRPDLYDSVFAQGGRWQTLLAVLQQASPREWLFGHGLGVGSNLANNLLSTPPSPIRLEPWQRFHADATPTALFVQLGLPGALLFYGLLAWATRQDARSRPFYLVLILVSLTVNIAELFPVNFLLGLALAHSLEIARKPAGSVRT